MRESNVQPQLVNLPMPISKNSALIFLAIFLLVCAYFTTRLSPDEIPVQAEEREVKKETAPTDTWQQYRVEVPLDCPGYTTTGVCPTNYPPPTTTTSPSAGSRHPPPPTCPEYFRWIHEDLRPWAVTGITRETLERAKTTANFRLVIVKGRAYVETFEKGFQTRDTFTLWGFLQLLRMYPGKVPDLELMFDCVDWPVVRTENYTAPDSPPPPPLFRYCGDNQTLDVVFPDWSFWGWAEINIKPWEMLLGELKEGNSRTKWEDRAPYAYWKGNPDVAETRLDLLKCNVSETGQDWNARVYRQDWFKESQQGYKQSDLASQCIHRYKIYIEGSAWSVSQKYILACDSVTLIVTPHYYDFFTRGLMPVRHFWPVKENDKCKSIKFAVDWGNGHKRKAQNIGRAASNFIQNDMKMENVYDYMFHLLNEYAKLLKFEPEVPKNATELCSESMACNAPGEGFQKQFMMDSLVKHPSETPPCGMPPPYDPATMYGVLKKRETALKIVDLLERTYWGKQQKKQQNQNGQTHP
ncbi:O-glucosyltransferase rumi homolog [Linum grandiflorum]